MKINEKDIVSGLFLALVAVVGIVLNYDHALGSARRMGPGYMPMLVFYIQLGLGLAVLAIGFFNGPDPLLRWTGLEIGALAIAIAVGTLVWWVSPRLGSFFVGSYNGLGLGMLAGFLALCWSMGWRLIGYISASMCIFALLLEKGGLMLAIAASVILCALAEPEHRKHPLGVLGITIFLLALCWWVFIKQLDIRVAVWPNQY